MEFVIRQAGESDIPDIMRIEADSFASRIIEAEQTFRERLGVFPQGFLVLTDRETDRALGYFTAELWKDRKTTKEDFALGHSAQAAHCENGEVLYIASMALSPALRGQGAGKLLFNEALHAILDKNPQISLIQLVVNEEWKGARAIYTAAGFSETGRLGAFFHNADTVSDGIIMEKTR